MTFRFLKIAGFTALFFIFAAQALYLAKTNSTISDEVAHIGAGYSYLKFNDLRLNPEHPPLVKQIAAIPLLFMDLKFPSETQAWNEAEQWSVGRTFLFTLGNPGDSVIFRARAALLPLALLMALLIFFWARELCGEGAAFFSLFLFSFFPEMIIHASLVTTDFAAAAFYFGVFYFLYRFVQTGKTHYFLLAGLATGLAFVSKYSTFALLPLLYGFAVVYSFTKNMSSVQSPAKPFPLWMMILITIFVVSHKKSFLIFSIPFVYLWLTWLLPRVQWLQNPKAKRAAQMIFLLLSVAFLVVLIVYFEPAAWFRRMRMDPFKRFFRGWSIFRDHSIGQTHRSYLFGEMSQGGWWYYYLIAMLVKIPVPILVSFFLGLAHLIVSKKIFRPGMLLFVLPPLIYWGIASFINKVNIGVRHILIVYPFLIVTAGAAFEGLGRIRFPKLRPALIGLLGGWLVCSSALAFPNYLSYFNGIAPWLGGRENILSDSNLSWGQDVKRLKIWMEENQVPEIYRLLNFNMPEELDYYQIRHIEGKNFERLQRKEPGYYAVDLFTYQGMMLDGDFAWLKTLKPYARVGGSILIYKF